MMIKKQFLPIWIICTGLVACGGNAELTSKVASVKQCINAPASVERAFETAKADSRIPVYVSDLNRAQYEDTSWYKAETQSHPAFYIGLENWSSLASLTDCRSGFAGLQSEYPKNDDVLYLGEFLTFAETTFKTHGTHQLEEANMELGFMIAKEEECLLQNAYPQAFISMEYDISDALYPARFNVLWDDGETITADGRDLLLRPIPSVSETGCTKQRNDADQSWINYALTWESLIDLTFSDYVDHKARIETITQTVETYNSLTADQHKEMNAAGYDIPPMGSYTAPVIYEFEGAYTSSGEIEAILKDCETSKPKTSINGRGQTLYTFPRSCRMVEDLCGVKTMPSLPQAVCSRVDAATTIKP